MAYIWSKFSPVKTRAREGEHPMHGHQLAHLISPSFSSSSIDTVHGSKLKYVLQIAKVLNSAMEKRHNEQNQKRWEKLLCTVRHTEGRKTKLTHISVGE